MNYNTQQRISPQDPEWIKIYNECCTQQGHFRQSLPKRQTKINAECKGQKQSCESSLNIIAKIMILR